MNLGFKLRRLLMETPHREAENFLASWIAVLIGTPTFVTFVYGWWNAMEIIFATQATRTFGAYLVIFWLGLLMTVLVGLAFLVVLAVLLPTDLRDFSLRWPAGSASESSEH